MIVFNFRNYKDYLHALLVHEGKLRKGGKRKLANAIRCQPSYLSRILAGPTHFSDEQAMLCCKFLSLSPEETHFFMLLVHLERAEGNDLRSYYAAQLDSIVEGRRNLKKRVKGKPLPQEMHSFYYSSWVPQAVHAAISITELNNAADISKYLGVAESEVREVLHFLEKNGLATSDHAGAYSLNSANLHLQQKSPFIRNHHLNWRAKTLDLILTKGSPDNKHYSAVLSVSKQDYRKVLDRLIEFIAELDTIVVDSAAETLCGVCFDLFELETKR